MGQAGSGPENGPGRRAVEVATAVIIAVVVASGVVAIGVTTRDDPQNTADSGTDDSASEEPDVSDPETVLEETSEPGGEGDSADEPSDEPEGEPSDEPTGQFRPEVTKVELSVDQPEYTGPCPVTVTFSARVTTNTGPLRADVEWRDADANEVEGERVQFGGPGAGAEPEAQGATITHEVEVPDDGTVQRTAAVIDPNEVASNTVEATVTCTPYAEITKTGDDFDADPPEGRLCHRLQFEASITVPHDMAVAYVWEFPHGTTDGPYTVEFSAGGTQTQSIPVQDLNLGDREGEFGYVLRITEPYDVTSDLVAYDVNGCSGPAT